MAPTVLVLLILTIVFAWVFSFPVCIVGGALIYWLLELCGLAVKPG